MLTRDPFQSMGEAAERFGIEPAELADLVIERDQYALGLHPWHRLEIAEIEVDEYNRAVDELMRARGHAGFPGLPVDEIATRWFTLRTDMIDLLGELRSGGLRTGIVSDNVKVMSVWRTMADWEALVDVVIDSSDVDMRKPDPETYLHACEQLDVDPSATAFLDDTDMNAAGAVAVGMTRVLVGDPDQAIADVRRLIA